MGGAISPRSTKLSLLGRLHRPWQFSSFFAASSTVTRKVSSASAAAELPFFESPKKGNPKKDDPEVAPEMKPPVRDGEAGFVYSTSVCWQQTRAHLRARPCGLSASPPPPHRGPKSQCSSRSQGLDDRHHDQSIRCDMGSQRAAAGGVAIRDAQDFSDVRDGLWIGTANEAGLAMTSRTKHLACCDHGASPQDMWC